LAGGYDSGEKMAPFRVGLTPLRRVLGAALVVLLLVGAVLYYRTSTSASVVTPSPTPPSSASSSPVVDPTPTPSTPTPSTSPPEASVEPTAAEVPKIRLHGDSRILAKPFQTVRIRGTYHGGPDTFVQAERREGAGRWVAFPLAAQTDRAGRFIMHVEFSAVGHHWVRVVDPKTRVVSDDPIVVVIEA
jgi:hypothetical protein